MKFINKGEPIKIRKENQQGYYWITLRKGEIIDLPENIGKRNNLFKVEISSGKIKDKIVETKQFEFNFKKELMDIKGIGKKTVKDILDVYTRKELIKNIKLNKNLPFRDDIEKKLRKKYG